MSTTAADILEKAVDVLYDEGWTQGTARNPETGGWCAHGAINRARGQLCPLFSLDAEASHHAAEGARDALAEHLGSPYSIVSFNDHPDRTMFDVIDAFQHTAKALRNGEITLPAPTALSL